MTPMSAEQAVVRLHRTIPAPPDPVYRAWLEPDLLRRWLAPVGLKVTRHAPHMGPLPHDAPEVLLKRDSW
jgi:uncharacterized protein YndB with AHSA1/START domain